jgi:sugar O-acyltransferase (sialic acid O-acetyltransferase NeuD family)
MKEKIVIIGGGGFGREVFALINKELFEVAGFIDNSIDSDGELPAPVLGDDSIIPHLKSRQISNVCIAIGNMQVRRKLFDIVRKAGLSLPSVIHKSATVLTSIPTGEGIIVYPAVVVMNDCSIGDGVLLNSGVTLGHDVSIGDFSNINPGANLAGRVQIGQNSMIGIGASIRENICIGNRVIVGAGSVVINDIPDDTIVYGVPAKKR